MLGNGRLEAQCFDGEKRLAHIRGKMRKKVRTNLSTYLFFVSHQNLAPFSYRSGLTRVISFSSHYENSKMARQMSS